MKRAIILLTLACLAPTQKTEWRYVNHTKETDFFASDARTDREGSTVRRWEKQTIRDDTPEGKKHRAEMIDFLATHVEREEAEQYGYSTANREYDCRKGSVRFLQFHYYKADGSVIYSTPDSQLNKWQSPPPDSIDEAMMLDACKKSVEMQ
jgi:hypothetical protein